MKRKRYNFRNVSSRKRRKPNLGGFFETFQPKLKVIAKYKNLAFTEDDLQVLPTCGWLNDTLIDFFILKYCNHGYEKVFPTTPPSKPKAPKKGKKESKRKSSKGKKTIVEEEEEVFVPPTHSTYTFGTTFYPLLDKDIARACKRIPDVRKTTIFDKDFIFIPFNNGSHWSLYVVCNLPHQEKKRSSENRTCIMYCDSLSDNGCYQRNIAGNIRTYLTHRFKVEIEVLPELLKKFGKRFVCNSKNMPFVTAKLPKQENSFDCGVFILQYVRSLILKKPNRYPYCRSKLFDKRVIRDIRVDLANLIRKMKTEQKDVIEQNELEEKEKKKLRDERKLSRKREKRERNEMNIFLNDKNIDHPFINDEIDVRFVTHSNVNDEYRLLHVLEDRNTTVTNIDFTDISRDIMIPKEHLNIEGFSIDHEEICDDPFDIYGMSLRKDIRVNKKMEYLKKFEINQKKKVEKKKNIKNNSQKSESMEITKIDIIKTSNSNDKNDDIEIISKQKKKKQKKKKVNKNNSEEEEYIAPIEVQKEVRINKIINDVDNPFVIDSDSDDENDLSDSDDDCIILGETNPSKRIKHQSYNNNNNNLNTGFYAEFVDSDDDGTKLNHNDEEYYPHEEESDEDLNFDESELNTELAELLN